MSKKTTSSKLQKSSDYTSHSNKEAENVSTASEDTKPEQASGGNNSTASEPKG